MSPNVTVTLPRAVFYEVCDLLQLMCVCGIRLYVRGCHPNMDRLQQAWDVFARAGIDAQPNQEKTEL